MGNRSRTRCVPHECFAPVQVDGFGLRRSLGELA